MPRTTALRSRLWRTWHNTFIMPLRYAVCLCLYLQEVNPPPPPPPKKKNLYNHLEWGGLGDYSLATCMKVACVKVKSVQQSHLLLCSNLIFPELMSASWKSLSRERCNVSGRIYKQGISVCLPGRIQIWNRWLQRYDRRASIMWASTSD